MNREPAHRCEAKAKGTGEQCKRFTRYRTKAGRWLCAMHGRNSSNPGGAPKENHNALKTGEYSEAALTRWERYEQCCEEAPLDHRAMREAQAKRNHARICFMYEQLLKTEAALETLAASGDEAASKALVIVRSKHKQGLDQIGDQTDWTQTEARSLLEIWLAQQAAIERAERTYGQIAEGLRPRDGQVTGGIGTLIINNRMPGVDDDDDDLESD